MPGTSLNEAIAKVKAKEMRSGGSVGVPKPKISVPKPKINVPKPKMRPMELDPALLKLIREAEKSTPGIMKATGVKPKGMQGGGEAKSGGKAVSINTPTGRRKMAEIRKIMPGASVDEVKKFGLKAGILKMKDGGEARKGGELLRVVKELEVLERPEKERRKFTGRRKMLKKLIGKKEGGEAVPPKFKGFSKLPESVQQKMNPDLAEKFGMGGDVKAKKSGNICRGRGIARKGTGFTIR